MMQQQESFAICSVSDISDNRSVTSTAIEMNPCGRTRYCVVELKSVSMSV